LLSNLLPRPSATYKDPDDAAAEMRPVAPLTACVKGFAKNNIAANITVLMIFEK
jgi:hypothetical protein